MAEGLPYQTNKQLNLSDGRPRIESDDLLIDILSRLPVKTLLRFRCVCKSWRALVSDSHLVTTHFRRSRHRRRLLFSLAPCQSIDLGSLNDVVRHILISKDFQPITLPVYFRVLKILGSCNGLVCLLGNSELIVVWNPSTGNARLLTVPNQLRFGSLRFYGFGYDFTVEDYKVVLGSCLSMRNGTRTTTVVILRLKAETWRTIDGLDYVHFVGQGCLVNGALHWVEMGWEEVVRCRPVLHARIMCFYLAEETFRELILLSRLSQDERFISTRIGTAEDRLFVYLYTGSELTMWVMKEYGVKESWTKIMQISTMIPFLSYYYFNPICILEKGGVLLNCDGRCLMLYNINGLVCRNVLEAPADLAPEPVIFMESLVSPFKENM